MIRPTENITQPDYWIGSGETTVYDAVHNDRLRISKGATDGCTSAVILDVEINPLVYSYYPPHSLDVIFVLDVTAGMTSGGSRKMALANMTLSAPISESTELSLYNYYRYYKIQYQETLFSLWQTTFLWALPGFPTA